MDVISILIGLVVGGSAIGVLAKRYINKLIKLAKDLYKFYTNLKADYEYVRRALEDGKISVEEAKRIIEAMRVDIRTIDEIMSDIEEVIGGWEAKKQ